MQTIRRSSSTIPFGYALDEKNIELLTPIDDELKALDKVIPMIKDKTLSLREGSLWLEFETGRKLSHMGLKKRVEVEQRRKKTLAIKRKFAKWLQETLTEIEKLETRGVGAYADPQGRDSTTYQSKFCTCSSKNT